MTRTIDPPRLRLWNRGDAMTGPRLNEPLNLLNDRASVQPPRGLTAPNELEPEEETSETWAFSTSTTRTERLEDATDPLIYIDVVVTTSVTVTRPDGRLVIIELE